MGNVGKKPLSFQLCDIWLSSFLERTFQLSWKNFPTFLKELSNFFERTIQLSWKNFPTFQGETFHRRLSKLSFLEGTFQKALSQFSYKHHETSLFFSEKRGIRAFRLCVHSGHLACVHIWRLACVHGLAPKVREIRLILEYKNWRRLLL